MITGAEVEAWPDAAMGPYRGFRSPQDGSIYLPFIVRSDADKVAVELGGSVEESDGPIIYVVVVKPS